MSHISVMQTMTHRITIKLQLPGKSRLIFKFCIMALVIFGRGEVLNYGVNSWTKSSIRHAKCHVITFRVRRNFAIRQRSKSSRRLPSLTSRVSLRCVAHFTRCIFFDALLYMSFRRLACSAKLCVFSTRREYSSCSSSTRRAYLFDASCVPLRRVVHTSSTRRAYLYRPLRRGV